MALILHKQGDDACTCTGYLFQPSTVYLICMYYYFGLVMPLIDRSEVEGQRTTRDGSKTLAAVAKTQPTFNIIVLTVAAKHELVLILI